jgi:hypothetical protein
MVKSHGPSTSNPDGEQPPTLGLHNEATKAQITHGGLDRTRETPNRARHILLHPSQQAAGRRRAPQRRWPADATVSSKGVVATRSPCQSSTVAISSTLRQAPPHPRCPAMLQQPPPRQHRRTIFPPQPPLRKHAPARRRACRVCRCRPPPSAAERGRHRRQRPRR